MKERPILFSPPMVRAILAGTKSQTRRAWKMPRGCGWYEELGGESEGWFVDHGQPWWIHVSECRCPYGQPGDRLWAREAWACGHNADHLKPSEMDPGGWRVHYGATEDRGGLLWRPSIHMPRWASRITLEVTTARVERLQDISEADAIAEGSRDWAAEQDTPVRDIPGGETRLIYRQLWEQINGPGSWDANPWVWVVEFKRAGGGNG